MTDIEIKVIRLSNGDEALQVNEGAHLVRSTPCLPWERQGRDTCILPIHTAIKFLLAGQSLTLGEDRTSILDFNLNEEKWTSIVQHQEQQGIYERTYEDGDDLVEALYQADPETITAGDLQPHTTGTTNHQRSSRRRASETTTEVDTTENNYQPAIRFLAITPTSALQDTQRPMHQICRLRGMLGSVAEARRCESDSSACIMATLMRSYINTFLGPAGTAIACSDEVASARLRQYMCATELDSTFRSGRTDDATMQSEGIDGAR